jgi:ABC-type spermidine/putrescine transport system permease subunit I
MKKIKKYLPLLPITVFYIIFLIIPISYIFFLSINSGHGFTIENYLRFFNTPSLLFTLTNTIFMAAITTIIDLVLAYPIAYYLARRRTWLSDFVQLSLFIPLFGGLYVAFAFMFLFLPKGLVNYGLMYLFSINQPIFSVYSRPTLIAAMSLYALPFVVLPLRSCIQGIDPNIEEAAKCLGANPLRTFLYITLPLSKLGIVSGVLLGFGWIIPIFTIPFIISFKGCPFMSVEIFFSMNWGMKWDVASTLSIILFIITFTLSYIYAKIMK